MKITEIEVKSILSKSQVYDYALNPYVGCQHNYVYCYAKFMKRSTGHKEIWGDWDFLCGIGQASGYKYSGGQLPGSAGETIVKEQGYQLLG
jgi:DNA repair photolyase